MRRKSWEECQGKVFVSALPSWHHCLGNRWLLELISLQLIDKLTAWLANTSDFAAVLPAVICRFCSISSSHDGCATPLLHPCLKTNNSTIYLDPSGRMQMPEQWYQVVPQLPQTKRHLWPSAVILEGCRTPSKHMSYLLVPCPYLWDPPRLRWH